MNIIYTTRLDDNEYLQESFEFFDNEEDSTREWVQIEFKRYLGYR